MKQGVVSYCNEAKMSLLKVQEETIAKYTEVSLECVAQMAAGVACANRIIGETDYAIATSGIAGPAGGTDDKPVGTVVIAVKAKDKVVCQQLSLSNKRSRNHLRELTVGIAFDMLRRAILGLSPIADYSYIKRVDDKAYTMTELR